MRTLFPILPHKVVHKERLARPRRSQYEFVAVGDDAPFHWFVRDVQMQGLPADTVAQLDTERTGRGAVVRFIRKEAQRWFDERVETLFGRKIPCVTRHPCPVECRGIYRIMTRAAFHQRELAAHVVSDAPQLLGIVRPSHYVEVGADTRKTERVRLVQVLVYPLLVYLIAPRITGERVHVTGLLFKPAEVFRAVLQKQYLRVDVVAGEEQPDGSGEGEPTVRTVGRKALVAHIRTHAARQVFRIRECMQAYALVAYTYPLGIQSDVFERSGVGKRER